MIRFLTALPIHAYRKWLSPRKGYKCAHHAVHQSGSCSDRILSFVQNAPLIQWHQLVRGQFSECREAAKYLNDKKRRDGKGRKCPVDPEDCCDAGDCLGDLFH